MSKKTGTTNFIENFHSTAEDTLAQHGWFVQEKDSLWWQRRSEQHSQLTLYTLRGDNWPDSANTTVIKNLLLKRLNANCFSAEVHLRDFMPCRNGNRPASYLWKIPLSAAGAFAYL